MMDYQGFWSYVHKDDEAEGGRIVRLAKDVAGQFEVLTGEPIDLFLDREEIDWGDNWRAKIDHGLSSVAFFIPVLTPRYFLSAECRRELQFFARRADDLGVKDLVLPLLYVDVPDLHDDSPGDDLLILTKTFQWQDWREIRFEDVTSGKYRRAVVDLAERLVRANRQAELVAVAELDVEEPDTSDDLDDDSPGVIDRLANAETAIPRWTETLNTIGQEMQEISRAMVEATRQVELGDAQGKGFAGRARTAKFLAARINGPSDRIRSLGSEFASQLHEVDAGVRAMIEMAPAEAAHDPEARQIACEFFHSIKDVSQSAKEALDTVQQMIDGIAPVERMSRDLRPSLRRLRQGLTGMLEARTVTAEWVALIEGSGVDCADWVAESRPEE